MKHEYDHNFFREISRYQTESFIKKYAKLNAKVYSHKYSEDNDLLHINLSEYNLGQGGILHLSHWTIRDIIFQKIRRPYGDDSSKISKISDRNMYYLIGLYNDYENELSKQFLKDRSVIIYLFGLAEQQFRGQVNAFQNDKKRNSIIFNEIDTENYFNIEVVVKDILDMKRIEFRAIMIILLSMHISHGSINPYKINISDNFFREGVITDFRSKLSRVIKYYTYSHDPNLFSKLNFLRYRYLFVEYNDTCVLTDGYMLEEKFADAELWLAREYYNKYKHKYEKNYFPNKFGILFEKYIEYVASQEEISEYLFNVNISKNYNKFFNGSSMKKVDYVLETERYRLIIECKSGVKPIAIKDPNTIVERFYEFMERIFDKAANQIKEAINNSIETDKKVIGVIIHAEKAFIKTQVKHEYLEDKNKKDFKEILLFDIHDYELLIALLRKSSKVADEILDDFIKNQTEDKLNFIQVMKKKYNPTSFLDEKEIYDDKILREFISDEALKNYEK